MNKGICCTTKKIDNCCFNPKLYKERSQLEYKCCLIKAGLNINLNSLIPRRNLINNNYRSLTRSSCCKIY